MCVASQGQPGWELEFKFNSPQSWDLLGYFENPEDSTNSADHSKAKKHRLSIANGLL